MLSIISTPAYAEDFTSRHVLAWEKAQQDTYFQTSIAMASIVASENDEAKSECIANWYFETDEKRHSANEELRSYLSKYPDSHPGAIVLAAVIKHCGSMNFTE
nr:hypothetical protein [uncultured Hyphomonas sp.]